MESVVKSFNIFVDTDRGTHTGTCTADDFELNLNRVSIDADKGQFLRLSVQNFSMSKNWTNVNKYNNKFRIIGLDANGTKHIDRQVALDEKDYLSRNELATEVANKVQDAIEAFYQNQNIPVSEVKPDANVASDKKLSFKLTFPSLLLPNGSDTLTELYVLFPTTYADGSISDAYQLLGGKKAIGDETSNDYTNRVEGTFDNNDVVFDFPYPCQLQTEQFVYLRTNLMSDTLETSSLGKIAQNIGDTHHSDILGRFTIASDEYVQFDSFGGTEYFVDLRQRHIQNLKLRLTNSHNALLPIEPDQNTLGNISFTCVIRCDIIQKTHPHERFTKDHTRTVPPRFDNLHIQYDGLTR